MIYPPLGFLVSLERHPLMAFIYHQIFCDESGKFHNPNDPLIAFAGVCITPEKLVPFDSEWRSLLRGYELDALHMKRASRLEEKCGYRLQAHQTLDERIDLLLPFADCIDKYFEMGFISAWDVNGYNNIQLEAKNLLGGSHDPFYWAFTRGLLEIVGRIGEDDRISIICDDDESTAWDSYLHYRSVGKAEPQIQRKAVSLSFANDIHFPALQAADMVAFLARHQANEEFFKRPNIWQRLYTRLTTEPEPPYGTMRWWKSYNDKKRMLALADSFKVLLEQKREKNKGIREIRSSHGSTVKGASQRNKEKTGRGKRRKT
jgi:Protein of unknown function (DUF3800)